MRKSSLGLFAVGTLVGAAGMHYIDSISVRCQAVFKPWLSESDMGDGASVGLTQITTWRWDFSWFWDIIHAILALPGLIWAFITSIPGAIWNWRTMPFRWLVSHIHLNWSLERPHFWNLPNWWPFPLHIIPLRFTPPWWMFILLAALWSLAMLAYLWRNGALYFIKRDLVRLVSRLRKAKATTGEDHEALSLLPSYSTGDAQVYTYDMQPARSTLDHLNTVPPQPATSLSAPRYGASSQSAIYHSAGGYVAHDCRCPTCGKVHTRA